MTNYVFHRAEIESMFRHTPEQVFVNVYATNCGARVYGSVFTERDTCDVVRIPETPEMRVVYRLRIRPRYQRWSR